MNEMTEADKVQGADKKAGRNVDARIPRMLVRALWAQEWALANPEAKGEDRKAAWPGAREAAMDKNLKTCRRALNTLARLGVSMTIPEKVEEDGGED